MNKQKAKKPFAKRNSFAKICFISIASAVLVLFLSSSMSIKMETTKKIIHTVSAPSPIGPYSQGVIVNGTLYISGQIAIHPKTNKLVLDDIKVETKQVMDNMKAVLKEANMSFDNVIKCTIFLSNMDDFGQVNEVYGSYFSSDFPVRETVQVVRLPKDVNVEISAIAVSY